MTSIFSVHSAPLISVSGLEVKTPGNARRHEVEEDEVPAEIARDVRQRGARFRAEHDGRKCTGDDDGGVGRIEAADALFGVEAARSASG